MFSNGLWMVTFWGQFRRFLSWTGVWTEWAWDHFHLNFITILFQQDSPSKSILFIIVIGNDGRNRMLVEILYNNAMGIKCMCLLDQILYAHALTFSCNPMTYILKIWDKKKYAIEK